MTPLPVRRQIEALLREAPVKSAAAVRGGNRVTAWRHQGRAEAFREVLRILNEHDEQERRDRAADCADETAWALRETKDTV
jgi:hypothetical protein